MKNFHRVFALLLCISVLAGFCPVIQAADEWAGWSIPAAVTRNNDGSITLSSANAAMVGVTKTQAVADEFEIQTRIRVNQYSGETGFQVNTGKYRLFLRINETNIAYFTGDGTSGNTTATVAFAAGTAWHDYEISVSGNTASLFIDERFIANLSIQTNTGADRLYLWTKSASGGSCAMTVAYFRYSAPKQEIIPVEPAPIYNEFSSMGGWTAKDGGVTFQDGHAVLACTANGVVQSLSTRVGVTEDFDYEFRMKLIESYGEVGAKLEWNGARIMLYFYEHETNGQDFFRYTGTNGINSYYFDAADNIALKDEWHTWKVEVRGQTGTIYLDGRQLVNYQLPSWSAADPAATFWVKRGDANGNSHMEVDYAKYTPIFYDVTLDQPIDGSAYLEGAQIGMSAAIEGADRIEYFANGVKIGSGTAPDFSFVWENASAGTYEVVARTPDGEKSSKTAKITIKPSLGLRLTAERETAFGKETVVQVEARDLSGAVDGIDFYCDGHLCGSAGGTADSFSYGQLAAGNHRLYAIAQSAVGESVVSEPVEVSVMAGRADLEHVTVPAAFSVSFTAVGEGKADLTIADGWYTLPVAIDQAGDYRLVSDSGAWMLYQNDVIIRAGKAARGTGNGVQIKEDGLRLEALELSAGAEQGDYYLERWQGESLKETIDAAFPQAYALEFDLLPGGGTLDMCMSDGAYLIDLSFAPDGIMASTSPLGPLGTMERVTLAPAPAAGSPILYRVQVSRGIAQLFADNAFVASFRLPEQWGGAYVDARTRDGAKTTFTAVRKTIDRYTYATGFDQPDGYWQEANGWQIADGSLSSGTDCTQPALLYAFARNPEFSARLRVNGTPKSGGVYLAARYNTENVYLRVGYDFASGSYKVIDTYEKSKVVAEAAGAFPTDEWAEVSLKLEGAALQLLVNGELVLQTQALTHTGFGRFGLFPDGVAVDVDEVRYAGEGKPTPGVTEYSFNGGHNTDMIRLKDGTLRLSGSGGTTFVSSDNGVTWTGGGKEAYLCGNSMRLQSGALLTIVRKQMPGDNIFLDYAYVSRDDGATYDGPYQVEPVLKNRITMNGKLTQAENGRVYFAVGEGGHGLEDFGTVGVYYSDDDGRTWQAAKEYVSIYNTGVNVQESKVVMLPDGTPRLYSRTDRGFLYYCDSHDGGYTWDTDLTISQFASVLCAFNIERDPYTGKYYCMWVYNNKNENQTKQYPRFRMALAVSDDCEQWEYLMDVDEFDYTGNIQNRFANLGIDIYEDAIYLNANRFEPMPGNSNQLVNRLYRVEKNGLLPLGRFSNLHLSGVTEPSEAVRAVARSAYAAYLGQARVLTGDRLVQCDGAAVVWQNEELYLSAEQAARYLGGAYRDGAILVGTERIALDGMTATIDGNVMVNAGLLERLGRAVHIADDGLVIVSVVESWDDPLMARAYNYIKSQLR